MPGTVTDNENERNGTNKESVRVSESESEGNETDLSNLNVTQKKSDTQRHPFNVEFNEKSTHMMRNRLKRLEEEQQQLEEEKQQLDEA